MYKVLYLLEHFTVCLHLPLICNSRDLTVTCSGTSSHAHTSSQPATMCGRSLGGCDLKRLNGTSSWHEPLVLLRWSVFSVFPTAGSQGGVKQDVGRRGLDWGGGDIRHLMVIKLEPALFEDILTVGCVMATIQTSVVVLAVKEKQTHLNCQTNVASHCW